ncbi:Retinol-binding protein pinta-like 2 [Homarus americanus]|uniref:Retinol-binding protein pinta-like 2 n=1 Tax=Homarus americanus TaxID=6706 RepID=A0A8J5MUR3_HOMAM|nr:Retinol-binding protein pinta-like 2 [Homarus americanus]
MVGEYVCTLSEELQKRAKEEINEDPERRAEDIQHIRDWFLRGCKFSLQRTKEKTEMFYTCKSLCPEWYKNRDPQDKKMRAILELGMFLPLPGYDNQGRKVVIIRTAKHDPKVTSMDEVFKATQFIHDILWLEDEQMSITGVVQMMDMENITAAHVLQMSPALLKKAITIWQV